MLHRVKEMLMQKLCFHIKVITKSFCTFISLHMRAGTSTVIGRDVYHMMNSSFVCSHTENTDKQLTHADP